MAYFKWDKDTGAVIASEIKKAAKDLGDICNSIDLFVQECDGKPDNLKGWEKEVKEDGGWFWKLLWDWTGDYEDFMERLRIVKELNTQMKNKGKVKLDNLSNALNEMQQLIEAFDDANTFSLANAYQGKENVEIAYTEDGVEVIVYTAPDGSRYTMSEMLNAFYTYSGMSMDGQLQGYLYAQANGIEFNAAYQSNILAGVNSTVGSINMSGGFGVASEKDILGVNSMLSQNPGFISYVQHDGNGKLTPNTGGSWYSNMEVGSSYLTTYTIADFITNPNHAVEQGLIAPPQPEEELQETIPPEETTTEEGVIGDNDQVTGGGMPPSGGEGQQGDGGTGGTGGGTGIDETNPNPQQESLPDTGGSGNGTQDGGGSGTPDGDQGTGDGGNGETVEENFNLDEFKDDTVEQFEPDFKDNYDEMARDKYESMDQDVITERREEVINETQTMIDNNDTDGLRNKLADYGYSEGDIDKIVNDPDALISAMVEGDQRQQLAEYAKDFAEKDGVEDYDTSYDDGQSYKDYQDGSSSSLTTNRSNDPEVKQAKNEYNEARTEYKEASEKVNEAATKTQESLDNVNSYKNKYGSDTSKWSKEEKADYKEAVKEYQEARNDYNQKREEYNEAKNKYDDAHTKYEEAKSNYDERIRESVKENDAQFQEERERHETVNVDVSDDALLPGGDSGMNTGSADGNAAADQGIAINDNVEIITGDQGTATTVAEETGMEDMRAYTGEPPVMEERAEAPIAEGEEIVMGTSETQTNDLISGTPGPGEELVYSTTVEPQKIPGTPRPSEELISSVSAEPQRIPGTPRPPEELISSVSVEPQRIPGTPGPGEELVYSTTVEPQRIPGMPAPAGELKPVTMEAQTLPGVPSSAEAVISSGSSVELISGNPAIADTAPQVDVIQGSGENTISVNDAALLNIVSEGEMNSIRARREEE